MNLLFSFQISGHPSPAFINCNVKRQNKKKKLHCENDFNTSDAPCCSLEKHTLSRKPRGTLSGSDSFSRKFLNEQCSYGRKKTFHKRSPGKSLREKNDVVKLRPRA